MLAHLSIKNYAIIEQITLDFDRGFTVITGETGAGKSILLGALSLILGSRVDTSVLNNKEKKCVIEGTFRLNETQFKTYFTQNDLDFEKDTIVRREITVSGKSRAFINDTPVTLQVLKELTSQLIDIHSQYQTLKLQDNKFQLNVIDSYAKLEELISKYKKQYQKYVEKKNQLTALLHQDTNAKSDIDYLQFQIQEIEGLGLKPNEKEDIQEQLKLINNVEAIKFTLDKASAQLNNSDYSSISAIREITHSFESISTYGNVYEQFYERINSVLIELEDIANEIEKEGSSLDFDEGNSQYLNDRLSTIYSLEKKHQLHDSRDLLQLLAEFNDRLATINLTEQDVERLKLEIDKEKKLAIQLGKEISAERKAVFSPIEKIVTTNLVELGMSEASFVIKHQLLDDIGEYGMDAVQFLFSANKGVAEQELEKIASGGELSRLMLTIKFILANHSEISSIVFDEIDTGVSGDIADKMATIMKTMSKHIQIISITHLPQVAAKGESHIKIYKQTHSGKTSTYLSVLSAEERVEEIAKMLSGKELSSAAKDNAKILLGK